MICLYNQELFQLQMFHLEQMGYLLATLGVCYPLAGEVLGLKLEKWYEFELMMGGGVYKLDYDGL